MGPFSPQALWGGISLAHTCTAQGMEGGQGHISTCHISMHMSACCLPCRMAELLSLTPQGGSVLGKQGWISNQPDPHTATRRKTSVFLLARDFRVCYRGVEIGVLAIPTETAGEEVGCEPGCLDGFAMQIWAAPDPSTQRQA